MSSAVSGSRHHWTRLSRCGVVPVGLMRARRQAKKIAKKAHAHQLQMAIIKGVQRIEHAHNAAVADGHARALEEKKKQLLAAEQAHLAALARLSDSASEEAKRAVEQKWQADRRVSQEWHRNERDTVTARVAHEREKVMCTLRVLFSFDHAALLTYVPCVVELGADASLRRAPRGPR